MKPIFNVPKPIGDTCRKEQAKSNKKDEEQSESKVKPKFKVGKSIAKTDTVKDKSSNGATPSTKKTSKPPSKPAKSLTNDEWDIIFSSVLSVADEQTVPGTSESAKNTSKTKLTGNESQNSIREKPKKGFGSCPLPDDMYDEFEDEIDNWDTNPPVLQAEAVESHDFQTEPEETPDLCELQPVQIPGQSMPQVSTIPAASTEKIIIPEDNDDLKSKLKRLFRGEAKEEMEQLSQSIMKELYSGEDKSETSDDEQVVEAESESEENSETERADNQNQGKRKLSHMIKKKSQASADIYSEENIANDECNSKKSKFSDDKIIKKKNPALSYFEKHRKDKKLHKKVKNDLLNLPKDFPMKRKEIKGSDDKNVLKIKKKKKSGATVNSSQEMDCDTLGSYDEPGTWVQCDNLWCKKWRHVHDVEDPALLPDKWFCRLNSNKRYNSCEASEEKYDLSQHIYTKFTPGSIVWAKMDGYPWWPAMVETDTEYCTYFELKTEESMHPTQYHVSFLDDYVTRAWIKTSWLWPYDSSNQPRNATLSKRQQYKKELDDAKKKANEAVKLSLKERLTKYGFSIRYNRKKKSKAPKFEEEFDEFEYFDEDSKTSKRKDKRKKKHVKASSSKAKISTEGFNVSLRTTGTGRRQNFDPEVFTMEATTAVEAQLPEDQAVHGESEEEEDQDQDVGQEDVEGFQVVGVAQVPAENHRGDSGAVVQGGGVPLAGGYDDETGKEKDTEKNAGKDTDDDDMVDIDIIEDTNETREDKTVKTQRLKIGKREKITSKTASGKKTLEEDSSDGEENSGVKRGKEEKAAVEDGSSESNAELVKKKKMLDSSKKSKTFELDESGNEQEKKSDVGKKSVLKHNKKSPDNEEKNNEDTSKDVDIHPKTPRQKEKLKLNKDKNPSEKKYETDDKEVSDDRNVKTPRLKIGKRQKITSKTPLGKNKLRENSSDDEFMTLETPKKIKSMMSKGKENSSDDDDSEVETIKTPRSRTPRSKIGKRQRDITAKFVSEKNNSIDELTTSKTPIKIGKRLKITPKIASKKKNVEESYSEDEMVTAKTPKKNKKLQLQANKDSSDENHDKDSEGEVVKIPRKKNKNVDDGSSESILQTENIEHSKKTATKDKKVRSKLNLPTKPLATLPGTDSVVPQGETERKTVKKGRYARAMKPLMKQELEDQNVPDLKQNLADGETEVEENLSNTNLANLSLKDLKRSQVKVETESEAESECLDLDDSAAPHRKSCDNSDSDELDLEVNSPKCVVEYNEGAGGSGRHEHGRFAGRCTERGSDSDPFDAIED